jgi:simple sugar transport system permease protein
MYHANPDAGVWLPAAGGWAGKPLPRAVAKAAYGRAWYDGDRPMAAALKRFARSVEATRGDAVVCLVFGLVAAIAAYILIYHTTFGFAARVAGGNIRAAKIVGLSVGKLILTVCFLAGSCAGLAGMIEVAAVQGRTNANLAAGYGFTGILVAFLARQNPLAIIPVAILLGGISASGGLLQRRLGLPDASVLVLQGIIFVFVLASDALYGRIGFLKGKS